MNKCHKIILYGVQGVHKLLDCLSSLSSKLCELHKRKCMSVNFLIWSATATSVWRITSAMISIITSWPITFPVSISTSVRSRTTSLSMTTSIPVIASVSAIVRATFVITAMAINSFSPLFISLTFKTRFSCITVIAALTPLKIHIITSFLGT